MGFRVCEAEKEQEEKEKVQQKCYLAVEIYAGSKILCRGFFWSTALSVHDVEVQTETETVSC